MADLVLGTRVAMCVHCGTDQPSEEGMAEREGGGQIGLSAWLPQNSPVEEDKCFPPKSDAILMTLQLVCVCVCVWHSTCMMFRGQLLGVGSNSNHQARKQSIFSHRTVISAALHWVSILM